MKFKGNDEITSEVLCEARSEIGLDISTDFSKTELILPEKNFNDNDIINL